MRGPEQTKLRSKNILTGNMSSSGLQNDLNKENEAQAAYVKHDGFCSVPNRAHESVRSE